ncbi:terminase small subunit [Haloechinothrix salitolerans]|uniref:Terminase small subunit actinomycetes phage-type domain-containing protein n=1 Tax=Haloechinothrix salitolerans TaxID=926830 RepID=A0ABW2BZ62_9PSEU
MRQEVEQAIETLDLDTADAAVAELARTYAAAIDNDGPIDTLGPRLLQALDALGLTPKARARSAQAKGASDDQPTRDPLDELRQRRAARVNGTAAVDTTAP